MLFFDEFWQELIRFFLKFRDISNKLFVLTPVLTSLGGVTVQFFIILDARPGQKLCCKSFLKLSCQLGFLSEALWIMSVLRKYSVLLQLKVLFQGRVVLGVPVKRFEHKRLPKKIYRLFFKTFSLTRFFCGHFSKYCKPTWIFVAFALKTTSP